MTEATPTHLSSKLIEHGLVSEEENLRLEKIYINAQTAFNKKQDRHGIWETKESTNSGRKPKRKVALLLGYCGTGYQGLQINPNVPSIELDLHKALALSGAVSKDNAMDPVKTSFVRCARTDKGVHAAGTVVSLKMIEDDKIIQKINDFLPPQIRVWDYVVVPKSFHAKNRCESRIYEYVLPTYTLKPCEPTFYPMSTIGHAQGLSKETMERTWGEPFEVNAKRDLDYRIPEATLAHFNKCLQEYIGTKNYHNFTVRKPFTDKSALRFIISIETKVFVKDSIEWISCKIHGQSFMIHQIRKMIGLAIMMTRTMTPSTAIETMFKEQKIPIPKAPSLGLLLERPVFDVYNKNLTENKKAIDFDVAAQEIEQFKQDFIYKEIYETEMNENTFQEWINVVDKNSDDYGWYLTKEGSIFPEYFQPRHEANE